MTREVDREARISALLVDYSEARDDERHFLALQGTCLTLAITALTLLGALAFKIEPTTDIPDPALAIAPFAVVVILLFAQNVGIQAVDRSFYMRILEREIRKELQIGSSPEYPGSMFTPFTNAEFTAASATAMSSRQSRDGVLMGSIVSAVVGLGAWIVFGSLTVALAFALDEKLPYIMLMAAVYLPLVIYTFLQAINSSARGRERFRDMTVRVQERLAHGLEPADRDLNEEGRTLLGYLALPRPDDVVKIVFIWGGAVGAWALSEQHSMSTLGTLAAAATVSVVIELFAYQARYQWNDVRGVVEDGLAAHVVERGRLPGGDKNVPISLAVALGRLYVVAVAVAALWTGSSATSHRLAQVITLITFLVFAIAVPYEVIKLKLTRPGTPKRSLTASLIIWVGLGYPLRFLAGWIAVGGNPVDVVFFLLLVGMWGLGVAFVSMTWFLEAASFVEIRHPPLTANYAWRPSFAPKAHLRTMLSWHSIIPTGPDEASGGGTNGGNVPFLRDHSSSRVSPWHLGTMVAVVAFGSAGITYFNVWDTATSVGVLVAALACLPLRQFGGRAQVSGVGAQVRQIVAGSMLMALLGAAFYAFSAEATLRAVVLLVVADLVPSIVFASFFASAYEDLKGVPTRLKRQVLNGLTVAYCLIIGVPRAGDSAPVPGRVTET